MAAVQVRKQYTATHDGTRAASTCANTLLHALMRMHRYAMLLVCPLQMTQTSRIPTTQTPPPLMSVWTLSAKHHSPVQAELIQPPTLACACALRAGSCDGAAAHHTLLLECVFPHHSGVSARDCQPIPGASVDNERAVLWPCPACHVLLSLARTVVVSSSAVAAA
jgi:hypothetical protein